jgi:hypothetical protein
MNITTPTDDATAAARRFLHLWITMLGLTDRPDRVHVEQLVKDAYRTAGLCHPRRIIWCSSPLAMTWVRSITTDIWQEQVGQDVRSLLIQDPLRRTWSGILRKMSREFRQSLRAYLEGGLKDVVRAREQALWDALADAVVMTFDDMEPELQAAIAESLESCGLRQMAVIRDNYGSGGVIRGQVEDHAITLAFLRRRLGLVAETQPIEPLIALLQDAHAFIAHENVCWISEPPTVVADDCLRYGDGWTIPISEALRAWAREWINSTPAVEA